MIWYWYGMVMDWRKRLLGRVSFDDARAPETLLIYIGREREREILCGYLSLSSVSHWLLTFLVTFFVTLYCCLSRLRQG